MVEPSTFFELVLVSTFVCILCTIPMSTYIMYPHILYKICNGREHSVESVYTVRREHVYKEMASRG